MPLTEYGPGSVTTALASGGPAAPQKQYQNINPTVATMSGSGVQNTGSMSPLVEYFIQVGLSPTVAVQLASKVGVMEQPSQPLANGIKMSPHDAVAQELSQRYGLRPDQAQMLAKEYTLKQQAQTGADYTPVDATSGADKSNRKNMMQDDKEKWLQVKKNETSGQQSAGYWDDYHKVNWGK